MRINIGSVLMPIFSTPRHPARGSTAVDLVHVLITSEQKMQNNKTSFIAARDFKGHLGVMASSPFPSHKPDSDFGDAGRGPGMPMRPARDVNGADDDGLAECCKNGSLEHLTRARDAIGREIQRRAGMNKVVRFVK